MHTESKSASVGNDFAGRRIERLDVKRPREHAFLRVFLKSSMGKLLRRMPVAGDFEPAPALHTLPPIPPA